MSHYLTGVQTRRSAALKARHFESFMEIHPKTAEKYNIGDRVLVRVESKEAASSSGANGRKPSGRIPFCTDALGGFANVNDLIAETLDPSCSMPGFKVCSVKFVRQLTICE
ncbi:molybdopterin dinucleotide binding domain-containing protein [Bacillus licheniformis]|nr:molybdopterin dinucleotide binding domain-containing protein [Bacillus licheniformis]